MYEQYPPAGLAGLATGYSSLYYRALDSPPMDQLSAGARWGVSALVQDSPIF